MCLLSLPLLLFYLLLCMSRTAHSPAFHLPARELTLTFVSHSRGPGVLKRMLISHKLRVDTQWQLEESHNCMTHPGLEMSQNSSSQKLHHNDQEGVHERMLFFLAWKSVRFRYPAVELVKCTHRPTRTAIKQEDKKPLKGIF